MILLNTCHIREKAVEKVYSELGRFKPLKAAKPALKIGVTGCVAQAEGEEIMRRQPHGRSGCRPAEPTIGCPRWQRRVLNQVRARSIPNFPQEDKFDHLPRGPRAAAWPDRISDGAGRL